MFEVLSPEHGKHGVYDRFPAGAGLARIQHYVGARPYEIRSDNAVGARGELGLAQLVALGADNDLRRFGIIEPP